MPKRDRAAIPNHLKIAIVLRKEILADFQPGRKLSTLRSLAERFGVSHVTMQQAMLILTGEGLIESRQGSGTFIRAQQLSSQQSSNQRRIALLTELNILHPTTSRFFAAVFDSLREMLQAAGHRTRLYIGNNRPNTPGEQMNDDASHELVADIERGTVVGVIALQTVFKPQWAARVANHGVPLIGDDPLYPYSVVGSGDIARLAAHHLISRGCRRLAMLGWDPSCGVGPSSCPQVEAFRTEIERSGLEFRAEWVRGDLHPNTDGAGWAEFREIWTAYKEKPDGLLIADDQLIADTARAINELRIGVPRDLSVVAQSSKGVRAAKPFPMEYVEYDTDAHARAMGEMLLKLLDHRPVEEPHVSLPYRLIDPPVRPAGKTSLFVRPSTE